MDLRKIIAARLRQQKIKVPAVARRLECNQQTLYNYLAGRSELGSGLLGKLLEILEIQIK